MAPVNGMLHQNLLLTVQFYFGNNSQAISKESQIEVSLQGTYKSKIVERKWQYIFQDVLYILWIKANKFNLKNSLKATIVKTRIIWWMV